MSTMVHSVMCYQITHGGEGDRGLKCECVGHHHGSRAEAAKYAARYFDGIERRRENLSDSDFDGASQVVEVVTEKGAYRYQIRCEVVREYSVVEEMPAPGSRDDGT